MGPSDLTLAVTLTLNSQDHSLESATYRPKMIQLPRKFDHRIWPSPWPWPWIFKVKYGICCMSAKNGPIATKQAYISIEPWGSNVTIVFDIGHELDFEFSRSSLECAMSQPKIAWLPRNESTHMDWAASMTMKFNLGHGIEGWGIGIYRIVTGVTSDFGVPSTNLVVYDGRW